MLGHGTVPWTAPRNKNLAHPKCQQGTRLRNFELNGVRLQLRVWDFVKLDDLWERILQNAEHNTLLYDISHCCFSFILFLSVSASQPFCSLPDPSKVWVKGAKIRGETRSPLCCLFTVWKTLIQEKVCANFGIHIFRHYPINLLRKNMLSVHCLFKGNLITDS